MVDLGTTGDHILWGKEWGKAFQRPSLTPCAPSHVWHNSLINLSFITRKVASPAGFEPTTPGLGILCSILLSYGDLPAFIASCRALQKTIHRWNGARRRVGGLPRSCRIYGIVIFRRLIIIAGAHNIGAASL
jgi:hypothetical protein